MNNNNTGYRNTGHCNTGYYNTGHCNTGNCNTGMFNTNEPFARFFNKESNIKLSDFIKNERFPNFSCLLLTKWIDASDMTAKEKDENENYKHDGGYLKGYAYKEAWKIFWDNTSYENKQKFLNLPNFDPEIFFEITGINVNQNNKKILQGKQIDVIIDGVKYSAIIE